MLLSKFSSKWLLPEILILLLLGCDPANQPGSSQELGEVHIQYSGKKAALSAFEQGLLLLHSFEYEDARTAFLEAQQIDPDMVMAVWGEAMTYNQGIWHRQSYEKGREALDKLGTQPQERLAKAQSDVEKDFVQSLEILYGTGKKNDRDLAYADYLGKMHKKYPENQEVAAFYALAMLASVPYGRDDELFAKSAAISKGILEENPLHPGALHYMIHSYDDPDHAQLAIEAADNYAEVAPGAAHALHMPSHIYVALGMWNEVIRSNIASFQASVDRKERMGLDNDALSYHALQWLLYGHLQKGHLHESKRIMRDMVRYTRELPSNDARSYFVRMQAAYLLETNDWENPIAKERVELEGLNIYQKAIAAFIEGYQAYQNASIEQLEKIINDLTTKIQEAELKSTDASIPMCSAGGWSSSQYDKQSVGEAKVMQLLLKSFLAELQEPEAAEAYLQSATELEASLSYAFGPPSIVFPSFERYGQWLLQQNRPEDALRQFEKALKRGPNRIIALKGKLEAARLLDLSETVQEVEELLRTISQPDTKEPENIGMLS